MDAIIALYIKGYVVVLLVVKPKVCTFVPITNWGWIGFDSIRKWFVSM